MPFSRILNRVLSYTEYGPEYHIDNQKVTKRPAVVDKIQQNDKTSLCLWYSNESNAEQYYLNWRCVKTKAHLLFLYLNVFFLYATLFSLIW